MAFCQTAKSALTTLEEFLDVDSISTPIPRPSTAATILVTARLVSGDAVFGPVLLARGTPVREVKHRLGQTQAGCQTKLLLGCRELGDADFLDGASVLELTVVVTTEPTQEERRAWIKRLQAGERLSALPEAARADAQVVTSAVARRADALGDAAHTLRADREFVMAIVRRYCRAFRFADETLRRDGRVALAALASSVDPLEFADPCLLGSRDFMLRAVAVDGMALRFASSSVKRDRAVVLRAMKENEDAVQFCEIEDDARVDRAVARNTAQRVRRKAPTPGSFSWAIGE